MSSSSRCPFSASAAPVPPAPPAPPTGVCPVTGRGAPNAAAPFVVPVTRDDSVFRALAEASPDAIVSIDADDRIVHWNAAAARVFGWSHGEAIGRELTIIVPPELRTAHRAGMQRLVRGAAPRLVGRTVEIEAVRRDGTRFPIELSLGCWSADGVPHFTSFIRDISARREAEAELRRSETRYRTLVERSPECIVLHDAGRVLYANQAALVLLGIADGEDLVGRHVAEVLHPDSHAMALERLARPLDPEALPEQIELRVICTDGRVLDVEAVTVAVTFDGRPARQTHVRDVTPQKALQRQLMIQAFHDPLTGLANRVLFRDRVAHALARGARVGARPVVLFLDLDDFKGINDAMGHGAGDALLLEVAARIEGALRASDTCARLGGDEFAVLLEDAPGPGTPESHAAHVAERVLAALQAPVRCDGVEFRIDASIGIAAATPEDDVEDVLRNADLAMYRAKARGKGRYELFEPAMHAAVRERLEIERALRETLESHPDALVLHFQPIARIDGGRIAGFEALVRWRHPERGLVPPALFIPMAEETGLIVALGRHVLREACRHAAAWQTHGPVSITVNLSARQLLESGLRDEVAAALADSGLPPACLVLEMTESLFIDDTAATLRRLRALKALGVRLAIDDFGTGFSSLGYLERFPVDLLKIDKTFVDRLGGPDESPLARAILGLGGSLGMRVVAEGIETAAQWRRLRELGCELGQGFFLARPLPAESVPAMLARSLPLARGS